MYKTKLREKETQSMHEVFSFDKILGDISMQRSVSISHQQLKGRPDYRRHHI